MLRAVAWLQSTDTVVFHNPLCVFLTGVHERPSEILVQAAVRPQTPPLSSKGREHNKIIDPARGELSRGERNTNIYSGLIGRCDCVFSVSIVAG